MMFMNIVRKICSSELKSTLTPVLFEVHYLHREISGTVIFVKSLPIACPLPAGFSF